MAQLVHGTSRSGQAHACIRPITQGRRWKEWLCCPGFLSPFGRRHSLLGPSLPAERLGLPHGRRTGLGARTSTGLPRSARSRPDRGGCSRYPEPTVFPRPVPGPRPPLPLPSGQPYPQHSSHPLGLRVTRHRLHARPSGQGPTRTARPRVATRVPEQRPPKVTHGGWGSDASTPTLPADMGGVQIPLVQAQPCRYWECVPDRHSQYQMTIVPHVFGSSTAKGPPGARGRASGTPDDARSTIDSDERRRHVMVPADQAKPWSGESSRTCTRRLCWSEDYGGRGGEWRIATPRGMIRP